MQKEADQNATILDPTALANLWDMAEGDREFMADLIETFLRTAPQRLADMRQAVERGDAAALAMAAHSLKSNCAAFGAQTLTGICLELERMGKAGQLTGAADKIAAAEDEYQQRVQAAVEAILHT